MEISVSNTITIYEIIAIAIVGSGSWNGNLSFDTICAKMDIDNHRR